MADKKILGDDVALYLFHQGNNMKAYEYMGCHKVKGEKGLFSFRVWAPHAKAVSVIGQFNGWDESRGVMAKINDAGMWECYLSGIKAFDTYKFLVTAADGTKTAKADPYAFHTETRPGTASKYFELDGYKWGDAKWQKEKENVNVYSSPMNIYEVHAGSWKLHDDGNPYTYRDQKTVGVCGWFYFANSQSAILTMLVPVSLCFVLEKTKKEHKDKIGDGYICGISKDLKPIMQAVEN